MKITLHGKTRYKEIFKWVAIIFVLLLSGVIMGGNAYWMPNNQTEESSSYHTESGIESYKNESCNVAKIKIRGYMSVDLYEYDGEDSTSSDDILQAIERAEQSENIKAIVMDINSGGGTAFSGMEVSDALSRAVKPTISVIREVGASTAYLSAVGTDMIFASRSSDVGGIGATLSYLDNVRKNQIEGLNYNQISAGKYKDMLDPDKYLTYDEKMLAQRDVDTTYEYFIKAVAEKRNLNIETVRTLADGSTMMGQMALENSLIDRIGGMYDVEQYLGEILDEKVVFCE